MTENFPDDAQILLDSLAQTVRRARKKQQLTQTEIAGLSGVGLRFISDLENAKPGLEIGRVLRVLVALGLKLSVESKHWNTF